MDADIDDLIGEAHGVITAATRTSAPSAPENYGMQLGFIAVRLLGLIVSELRIANAKGRRKASEG